MIKNLVVVLVIILCTSSCDGGPSQGRKAMVFQAHSVVKASHPECSGITGLYQCAGKDILVYCGWSDYNVEEIISKTSQNGTKLIVKTNSHGSDYLGDLLLVFWLDSSDPPEKHISFVRGTKEVAHSIFKEDKPEVEITLQ